MTQTYQKSQKREEHPGTLKHLKTSTKHLHSLTLSMQCRRSRTCGCRLTSMAQRRTEPGESQAEIRVPHTSTGRRGTAWKGARPRRVFQGFPRDEAVVRREAGRGQLLPAKRRECRAGNAEPGAGARGSAPGRQRHTGDGGSAVCSPALCSAEPACPLCRQPRELNGKNAAARRAFLRGAAARRGLDSVLEMPPLKLLPFCREGWVGQMSAPVPVGCPGPKGAVPILALMGMVWTFPGKSPCSPC